MYWINSNKAFIGFWRDGKQIGIGKCFLGEKIKFGFWNENNKVFFLMKIISLFIFLIGIYMIFILHIFIFLILN